MPVPRTVPIPAKYSLAAGLLLGLLLVSGCMAKTSPPLAAGAKTGATKPAAAAPGPKADYRIVIITNGSSPFWDSMDRGIQAAGTELGVEVDLIRNDASEGGQIRRLEQIAARSEVKGVGVSVIEAQAAGVAEQMQALRKAGVHVITIDSDGPTECREAFIGTNNLEAGRELGRLARQLLPGGGKAVCFVGIMGAQNARDRIAGFEEGAGNKIQRVDTMEDGVSESKARNNVTAAMQNHPDPKILAGIWSYNAPAIADAVEASGRRNDFKIVAFDAEPNAITAMEQGLIDVMVVQNPYDMGYQGVRLLNSLIREDQAGIDDVLHGKTSRETGLKVVVPDESSPLKSPYLMPLKEFKTWLVSQGLEGS